MTEVSQKNHTFTFDLLKQYGGHKSWKNNLLFSSMGIFVELGAIALGTSGSTKQEIMEVIGQQFLAEFSRDDFIDRSVSKFFTSVFHSAPLNRKYAEKIKQKFGTFRNSIDFTNRNSASLWLNCWISDVTNDHISGVLNPTDINPTTSLMYVEASLMSLGWLHRFRRVTSTFTLKNGKVVPVKAITTQKFFNISIIDDSKVSVCEIPFANPRYVAVVVVPYPGEDLHRCVHEFTGDHYQCWLEGLSPQKARITLPRFCIRGAERVEKYLKRIGITKVTSNQAEMDPASTAPNVSVGGVISASFIMVDEDGVLSSRRYSHTTNNPAIHSEHERRAAIDFVVDKPFLFLIHDCIKNIITYCCVVTNPNSPP